MFSHSCSSFSIPLQLPPTSSLLRSSASCLKAVCSALAPDSLIPSRLLLVSMYSSSCASYEPRPVNISYIVLPPELREFVENFSTYQHDCWSYEQVGNGVEHCVVAVLSVTLSSVHSIQKGGHTARRKVIKSSSTPTFALSAPFLSRYNVLHTYYTQCQWSNVFPFCSIADQSCSRLKMQ